ncbi:MAG TPA: lysozyme inhibitor LprI family protein [Burkholderiales bacterium]|nr:lysozyme inhibitor LprI family protein [Burkholderiales bacterium]
MMRFVVVMASALAALSSHAQYNGPAVEACRALAKQEAVRDGTRAKDIVFERDQNLQIERYTRKIGNQFVSSILRGNGAVVLDGAPSAELSFICLLADDKRAVFFDWLPRVHVPAVAQCTRDGSFRDKPRPCLETLLQVAENDLMQIYALHFQDARERDQNAGNENLVTSFRKANDEWRQYRDAECARRRDHTPKSVTAEDYQLACMVELTRRRVLDMR